MVEVWIPLQNIGNVFLSYVVLACMEYVFDSNRRETSLPILNFHEINHIMILLEIEYLDFNKIQRITYGIFTFNQPYQYIQSD